MEQGAPSPLFSEATQMKRAVVALSLTPLLLLGCLDGSTGPEVGHAPEILLTVTGGLVGVDYTLLVDGRQGEVIGESCVSGCDFESGQFLRGLSTDQTDYLAELFQGAGVLELDGTDFGNECCDQFHYDLTYTDDSGSSHVMGTSEAFPADLREAVAMVAGFASDEFPVVVNFDTRMELWPRDALIIQDVRINGDWASVETAYSGGCAPHQFDLVVFGGWMESDPVQVRAFLSHDGHDDPCDGLVLRTIAFDLKPLKNAYQEAYGVGAPGTTTLIIQLDGAGTYSSTQSLPLEYTF
jgi:hypothetical protein